MNDTSSDRVESVSLRRSALSAVFPLALLLAVMSIVGITYDGLYARETANWSAQAIGQDWVDLLFGVPWLVLTAAGTLRGSRRAALLLAGGLLYTVYEFLIYAFAVHFNPLFLVYCAGLGLSAFCLAAAIAKLMRENVCDWFDAGVPTRAPGVFLVLVGASFALLWLAEVVPAVLNGTLPASVVAAGIPTNPVQVIDLSVILPAHVIVGLLLLRKHRLGFAFAPPLLAFGVLMALSIAGMMVVMFGREAEQTLVVAGAMGVLSLATASVLFLMLRRIRPSS